jgi:hypothetical protein
MFYLYLLRAPAFPAILLQVEAIELEPADRPTQQHMLFSCISSLGVGVSASGANEIIRFTRKMQRAMRCFSVERFIFIAYAHVYGRCSLSLHRVQFLLSEL